MNPTCFLRPIGDLHRIETKHHVISGIGSRDKKLQGQDAFCLQYRNERVIPALPPRPSKAYSNRERSRYAMLLSADQSAALLFSLDSTR